MEDLYTGPEFQGQRNLARLASTFTILLAFSSGIPLMYGIGFIFFGLTFALNKYLLIHYYKKSEAVLDPNFATEVIYILRFLIFFKMGLGILNFCNPSLTVTLKEPKQDIPLKLNLTETFSSWNEGLGDFYKNLEESQDLVSFTLMH